MKTEKESCPLGEKGEKVQNSAMDPGRFSEGGDCSRAYEARRKRL